MRNGVPMITTVTAAQCAVKAIAAIREGNWGVSALQDYFPQAASVDPSPLAV